MATDFLQTSIDSALASLPEAVRAYLGNPERVGVEVRSAFLGLSDTAQQSIIRALRDGSLNQLEAEDIHDIAGNLLFRDFVVRLSQTEELTVRTGANRALGSLIVSVAVAPPKNRNNLVSAALAFAKRRGLGAPVEPLRVVCYAYPRLGVMLKDRTGGVVFVDLLDPELSTATGDREGESAWRPLDQTTDAAASTRVTQFDTEQAALHHPPGGEGAALPEKQIPMTLVAQEKRNFCALASAQMILKCHGIEARQVDIGKKMDDLERIADEGTRPTRQAEGLNKLCQDKELATRLVFFNDPEVDGEWDRMLPEIVSEINHNRPVQRQLKSPLHVDVIAGMRGVAGTPDFSLCILDPRQPEGEVRWDKWQLVKTNIHDLIFLQPKSA